MGQGVHPRGGGHGPGQSGGNGGIRHGVRGNQREIVDDVFVMIFFVGDHGGQRRFTAATGGGGHGDEKRRGAAYFEESLHLEEGAVGSGDPRAESLGAVHG